MKTRAVLGSYFKAILFIIVIGLAGPGCGGGASEDNPSPFDPAALNGLTDQQELFTKFTMALAELFNSSGGIGLPTDLCDTGGSAQDLFGGDLAGPLCDLLGGGTTQATDQSVSAAEVVNYSQFNATLGGIPVVISGELVQTTDIEEGNCVDVNLIIASCPAPAPTTADVGAALDTPEITCPDEVEPDYFHVSGHLCFSPDNMVDGSFNLNDENVFDSTFPLIFCDFQGTPLEDIFGSPSILDQVCQPVE